MRRILLATLVALSTLAPATAEVRIKSSPGGQIGEFLDMYAEVKDSGQKVVIDGPCLSACTLVLGVVPRDRICVTKNAELGFHAAWMPTSHGGKVTQPVATKMMMDMYPSDVKGWIRRRGGLHTRLIVLRGHELAALYPRCI